MQSMIFGLKICGKTSPVYNKEYLHSLSKHIGNKDKLRYFVGTVKRVLRKKI